MKRLLTAFFIAGNILSANAQLKINELMQSNIENVFDEELNEFPDSWVELYNESDNEINLSDYRIGIKNDFSKAYQLPSKVIEAGCYALIFCDKVGKGMHTDFRLESGKGGEVYVFNNEGNTVDKVTGMKKQPAPNIAYGCETDGSSKWGYMLTPTPGKCNSGGTAKTLLSNPVFSEPGGVYSSAKIIRLHLYLPDDAPEGAVIRYTTDGTEPTEESPIYSSVIKFNTTNTIRAKLFCDGYLTAPSITHSYIFHNREQTLPVISIVTDNRYFYDDNIGIYIEGAAKNGKKNYENDWRRPINIEFFMEKGNTADLNQLCETRICGGVSRGHALKSLVVYANKRFGTKRLEYEFFPTQKPGLTDFKSLMLRNAGNDFDYVYFRDAAIQHNMAMHSDLDWQGWRPAIFYFNGKYMGMLNIRERSNEDNIYTNYNGLEDIDMFENWWELKTGTWDNYNAFKNYYTDWSHTNAAEYEEWMDVTEFSNLMIMNIFHNNLDFPGNNIIMWRPIADGGKWRWVAKDTDFGLGLYDRSHEYKYIHWLYDHNYDNNNNWANSSDHTRLFRRLMADDSFKYSFVERMCVYMGDFLNGTCIGETIDSMYNVIKTEYPYHRELFNRWWPNHQEEVEKAKTWAINRTTFMYNYINSYFSMGGYSSLLINDELTADLTKGMDVTINDIHLSKGSFDGKFFNGRIMNITAECEDTNKEVKGWKVVTKYGARVTTETYDGKTLSMQMPSCQSISVNAITGESSGINTISADKDFHISVNGNMITVSYLSNPTKITICDIAGQNHISKTISDKNHSWKASHKGIYIVRVGDTTKRIIVK